MLILSVIFTSLATASCKIASFDLNLPEISPVDDDGGQDPGAIIIDPFNNNTTTTEAAEEVQPATLNIAFTTNWDIFDGFSEGDIGLFRYEPGDEGCRGYGDRNELGSMHRWAQNASILSILFLGIAFFIMSIEQLFCRFVGSRLLMILLLLASIIGQSMTFAVYGAEICQGTLRDKELGYSCSFGLGSLHSIVAILCEVFAIVTACFSSKVTPMVKRLQDLDPETDPCCCCAKIPVYGDDSDDDDEEEENVEQQKQKPEPVVPESAVRSAPAAGAVVAPVPVRMSNRPTDQIDTTPPRQSDLNTSALTAESVIEPYSPQQPAMRSPQEYAYYPFANNNAPSNTGYGNRSLDGAGTLSIPGVRMIEYSDDQYTEKVRSMRNPQTDGLNTFYDSNDD